MERGFAAMLLKNVFTRVRGMVTQQRHRSDRARFPMNTFLADLMSPDRSIVVITKEFPRNPTENKL